MFVRRLNDIIGTDKDIKAKTWNSRRLLLKGDGMGFSLHDTVIFAGTSTEIWYKNHLEAVYCIEGHGQIKDLETEEVYKIEPGMMYALNNHDRHILTADEGTDMRMVCVFNPPIVGDEVHDKDGAYPIKD